MENLVVHYYFERYLLDVVITTSRQDLAEARQEALERSQLEGRKIVALYNSLRDETVYL